MNIKQILKNESEENYQKFSSSLIPNIDNILGVRLPKLRKIANEIYKTQDWQKFLQLNDCEFMEEIMLQGMVIGLIKSEPETILHHIKNFVPKIDNWSVCDSFCNGLKFTNKNKELVWSFIQPYFNSDKEYEIRFAYVMTLSYFLEEKYLCLIFEHIENFKDDRYYAKMAAAWALSMCFVKFPNKTYKYLKTSKLDTWTFNKTIQKICESLQVDKETKMRVKEFKR